MQGVLLCVTPETITFRFGSSRSPRPIFPNFREKGRDKDSARKRITEPFAKANKHIHTNQLLSDKQKDLVVLLKPNSFQDYQELIKIRELWQ